MTVIVYVWRFRMAGLLGFGNVGHAALEVRSPDGSKDCYLSWWPGGGVRGGRSRMVNKKLKHTQNHYMNFGYSKWSAVERRAEADRQGLAHWQDQASDKELEERSADAKYRFNLNGAMVLNELRIKTLFDRLHQGTHVLSSSGHAAGKEYSLVHANCSDAVAAALEAGGAGKLVPRPAVRYFWTPTDIAKWCDKLVVQANLAAHGSAQRAREFTGNDISYTGMDWKFSALHS